MKWKFLQMGPPRNEGGGEGGEGGGGQGGGGGDGSILNPPGGQGGGGGGGDQPWYHGLDESIRNNPYVSQSKDLGSFVKSAIDTKSMVGANTIKLPGEKATPEERADFFKKLGRPDDAKGYTPTTPLVADHLADPTIRDQMANVMLEAGLTKAQGEAIFNAYFDVLNKGYTTHTEQAAQRHTEGVTALKNEWGANYENNVKTAQLAARELGGGNELLQKLQEAGLGSDPLVVKFLHNVGTKLLDDSAVGGGDGGNRFSGTQEAAVAEINRLKTDAEFQKAWGDANAPGHKEAVDRWLSLHERAYPGKQKDEG